MNTVADNSEIAGRFAVIANRFCTVVDSVPSMERTDLLLQIYQILPKLIDEAISLPDVKLSDNGDPIEGNRPQAFQANVKQSAQEWGQLYNLLIEKLGDWDRYWQVVVRYLIDEYNLWTYAPDVV